MQLVNALVGAVTLGQGALALDFTKMAGKDIAVELLKTWGGRCDIGYGSVYGGICL